jgi:acetyltransferase
MMFNALTAEQIGFSKFASIGNKLDVNEADLLEYLLEDKETGVIFCYLEGIAEGRRLMEVAQRSQKPIVLHKSNRSAQGAAIARSHSASLSTDDAVVDAAFAQCGIVRVFDQQEAMEGVKAFLFPHMKGNCLGIISRSGGHAVMAADAAEECGFHLPSYPEALTRLVHEHSRAKVIQTHNPLDLGDLFDFNLYRTLVEKALVLNEIDGLVFIHNYQGVFDAEESRRLLASLGGVIARSEKPVAVCVFTSKFELDHIRKILDYSVFTDPREAIRSLALNRDRNGRRILAFSNERPPGVDRAGVQAELDSLSQGPIPARNLACILAAYGIRLVPWQHAQSEDAAVAAAGSLGFPVALKTAQPEVLHKSDAGGVYLGLTDESSVRMAYRELSRLGPAVLVQAMAEPGLEWFVGGRRDRQFGPVVVSGPGGIYVEILRETGIRVAPVTHEEAARLLDESKAAALLSGFRGGSRLDRNALIDIVVRTSWLLEDFPQIRELDLNPVHVFAEGCYALDWRASKGLLQ